VIIPFLPRLDRSKLEQLMIEQIGAGWRPECPPVFLFLPQVQ
jgi:hypothetical protein